MRNIRWLLSLAALGALCAGGCALSGGVAPAVTPAMAAGKSEAALREGRRLYATRCISCHSLEPPSRYTPPEWRHIVADMADEGELSAAEQELVLGYLLAARAVQ